MCTFLLFYSLGKSQWGWYTHEHQYRWLFSAAYLSGDWAALVMVLLLTMALTLSVWLVSRYSSRCRDNVGGGKDASAPSSVVSRAKSADSRDPIQHRDLKIFSIFAACFCLNSCVVLCVQGAFVYVITWHDVSPTMVVGLQLLLACFSLVWDNVMVLKVLMDSLPHYLTAKSRIQLQNLIIIFNGVVAPVIVVGLTDPNCFSELITTSAEISTTSSIEYCVNMASSGFCSEYRAMVSH
jgi:hypothetical protein